MDAMNSALLSPAGFAPMTCMPRFICEFLTLERASWQMRTISGREVSWERFSSFRFALSA